MKNIVYGLRDPRNDVYQYIGKSTVGNSRALQHLTLSHSQRVNEWVKELESNWLYPHVDIIEEVEYLDSLPEREKYWINYYFNLNPNLLNIQLVEESLEDGRTEEDVENFEKLTEIIFKLPEILKRERLFRNINQENMSKELGMSRSTLSLIENGYNVNLDSIKKYILALKGLDIKKTVINKQTS